MLLIPLSSLFLSLHTTADAGPAAQTKEAALLARSAGAQLVVALTKCDVADDASKQRALANLAGDAGIVVESLGGTVPHVNVAGLTGEGIDDLVDTLELLSGTLELQAEPKGAAQAVVLDSDVVRGQGTRVWGVNRLGSLRKNDCVVAGSSYGRVRTIEPAAGAGPGEPFMITGLSAPPPAGSDLLVVESDKRAKSVAEYRVEKAGKDAQRKSREMHRQTVAAARTRVAPGQRRKTNAQSRSDLARQNAKADAAAAAGRERELALILRADVSGTLEALRSSVLAFPNDEVAVRVVSADVGAPTSGDVEMAAEANATVVAFNSRTPASVQQVARRLQVCTLPYPDSHVCPF